MQNIYKNAELLFNFNEGSGYSNLITFKVGFTNFFITNE